MAAPQIIAKPVEASKSTRKPRSKAPENESKADKFRRLINHRMPRLIKLMRAIVNLASASQYESTLEQRSKVIETIKHQCDRVIAAYKGDLVGVGESWKI